MNIKKIHILAISVAVIILALDIIFWGQDKLFYFILGIACLIGISPFIASILIENEKEKEKEEMFLEFSRNLVESVKSGTPISRSIINMRDKSFGSLTPHINKLANQISLGIPVKQALENFAIDVDNRIVSRAVVLISEAEQAGGQIESILESVTLSINQIEKLKKERKAAIYNLIVQGYIIFAIFIVIMLFMEFKILPMTSSFGGTEMNPGDLGLGAGFGFSIGSTSVEELSRPFLYLLLVQGFFAGLTIGKLAEGSVKAGLKHSFILVALSYLVSTGIKAFLG